MDDGLTRYQQLELDGKFAERIAKEIASENTLIQQRTTWGITVQGLLLASLGFIHKLPKELNKELVLDYISAAGIILALTTLMGFVAAMKQITDHIRLWKKNKVRLERVHPKPFAIWWADYLGLLPVVAVCSVLMLFWISIR
ncbi:MAG: hypothetical protein HC843_01685 [Sphingomonadales bacterium]|nr:hypothetical protein [Sphingomonadales bacterium]